MALPRPTRAPAAPTAAAAPGRDTGDTLIIREPTSSSFQLGADHRSQASTDERPIPAGPRLVTLRVALAGVIAYAVGWYASFYGVLPGVFLASDIGLPFLLLATLRGILRINQGGARDPLLGKAAAGLPRAASWAIGVYWVFATLTNVLQLAIGIGGGILLYQAYMMKGKVTKLGYNGYGPSFVPTLVTVGAYAGWQAARTVLGPLPGFDAMSAAAGFVVALGILRSARARLNVANAQQRMSVAEIAARRNVAMEKKTLAAVLVGYVFFRIFISNQIPYGPIVEWFLLCVGVLFFAIAAAERIGTVPTARSLPDPGKRTHIQRVSSLPDRHLARTEDRLKAFIERGGEIDELHAHFAQLLTDSGVHPDEAAKQLAPLRRGVTKRGAGHAPAESMGLEARSRFLASLVAVIQAKRVPTGTLKAGATVQTPGPPRTPTRDWQTSADKVTR